MQLLTKLREVAAMWVEYHSRTNACISLRTLGVRCVNNAKLFDRDDMNVGTYERVVQYLDDKKNWPLAIVPADARKVLDALKGEVAKSKK